LIKCELLFSLPFPLSLYHDTPPAACPLQGYTLLTTGLLVIWLIVVPFGLWGGRWWDQTIAMFILASLLLGVDEVSSFLEMPFLSLPLAEMVESTRKNCSR
jgi:hypothetical protein